MRLSLAIFAHCWGFMSHSCFWIIGKQNPAFPSRQTKLVPHSVYTADSLLVRERKAIGTLNLERCKEICLQLDKKKELTQVACECMCAFVTEKDWWRPVPYLCSSALFIHHSQQSLRQKLCFTLKNPSTKSPPWQSVSVWNFTLGRLSVIVPGTEAVPENVHVKVLVGNII